MKYKIEYDLDLEKALKKIPKDFAQSIKEKIEKLADDPRPNDAIKLSGRDGYRIRIGNYRVVYAVSDDKVLVLILDIDGRKDIYKKR